MARWMRAAIAVIVFAAAAATPPMARGQTPADVPPSHWAYDAVNSLAEKGLIKGYPPTGQFFGGRTVTRYEMATIIQRVLARVEELSHQPSQAHTDAAAITSQQLAEIKRLVNEFRVELTVLGTDLQKAKEELSALRADVGVLREEVHKEAETARSARALAEEAKEGTSALADAVKEQSERVSKLEGSKVDAGTGRIKINGLIQIWGMGELDAPNRGQTDTFRLRRSELKLSGTLTKRAYWWVLIDPAKSLSLNTTSSGGNVTGVSVNQSSNILQELVAGYTLAPGTALEIGQQKVPLSMEGWRSASQLLTVERSIFNLLPVNAGRVGDIRDVGLTLRYAGPRVEGQLAILNDSGNTQNTTDPNNAKDIVWHLDYKALPGVMIGAYQDISGGVGASRALRHRIGVEGAFTFGRHHIETEWVQARDGDPAIRSHGGYLLYAYSLSAPWQLVARGEYWNPNRDLHGASAVHEYDLTLGANYYLMGHNAKIQFNWIRKNINGPVSSSSSTSFLGLDRNLFLMNFQEAF
ncbi:MAG: porin [Chthonomonadales bacterium]